MAEITRLVEILRAERDSARKDRLRLDSIKPGLQRFNSIVRFGTVDSGDGKIQLEHWSREQIENVLAIARLIVSSSISTTVEQVDPTVAAVIENTIEFCICLLERLECDDDGLSLQNEVILFLEETLTDGIIQNFDGLCDHRYDDFLKSLPDFPEDIGNIVCNNSQCHQQGSTCFNDKNPIKRFLVSLSKECLQPEVPVLGFAPHSSSQLPNGIITLIKHFGVVHAKCLPRLLMTSVKLLEPRLSTEEMSKKCYFIQRSSLITRMMKMLGILTRDIPFIPFDFDLMNAVILYGDNLMSLFRNEFEFVYSDIVTSTDTLDNQLLSLLEEFIQLVRVVFCDGSIFQNIQICIIGKMLDILDSKVWKFDSITSTLRTPLAYAPKVIMYLVKLIKDVKCQTKTFMCNEKFDTNLIGFSSTSKIEGSPPSWNIFSEKINLLKKCTADEHLSFLFPPSKHWLDDLINLAYFFHGEGIKLRLKINGMHSSHKKSVNSDTDSTLIHEDEALFGDLFSETNRPTGPDSRLEQTDVDCSSTYSNQHMLIHAATELLVFLKECCFNPEWNRDVYENACKMLNENHVSYLTSILSCQRNLIDGSACNTLTCSQSDLLNINQVCFGLLHELLVQNVFSSALEEHFVDQVLRLEDGKYVYNDYTLTLLAHVLFASAGLSVSQLTTRVYENFVNFIIEKSTSSLSNYVDLKDFVGFLPCVFHLELLLMAFHLSNDSGKIRLASYVFSSVNGLGAPPAEYNAQQLSFWGLLASRLLLMVHHFVLFPSGCPSWLYVKFRSTLGGTPTKLSISSPPNDHLASWTIKATLGIMGEQLKETLVTSTLFPYLIDFSLFSSTSYVEYVEYQNLGLSCSDLLTSFSYLLCSWNGKKADMLEDLIIERYIYTLCWDTFSIACSRVGDKIPIHIDSKDDSLSTKCFLFFGQLLLRNNSIDHDDPLLRVVNELFQQVPSIETSNQGRLEGWNMLRNHAFLSLVLSLLHSGMWVSSVKNSPSDVDPFLVEPLCRNTQFLTLAKSATDMILQNNQGRWLVDILLSCLKMSLQAFQDAFVCIFNNGQTFARGFSPSLLLKHTMFSRSKQDELLQQSGCNSSKLDSVLLLLPRLEKTSKGGNNRSIIPPISRSLLHGFPSHPQISSAVLVSSALNIQDIVCVLDCLFNLKGVGAVDMTLEKDTSHLLWEVLMTVKSDLCFQNIHEKCEAILTNLYTPMNNQLDHGKLFQLKQIEGFLREMNSEHSDNRTLELLVFQAIELIEALRRDPSNAKTFKFYLGATGASEEGELFYSRHHGDILIMINALDKCPSESINVKVLNFFVDLLGSSMSCLSLNERFLQKFISFDLTSLSKWLEVRLLGSILEELGKGTVKMTSSSLREATMTFLTCLVSLPCEKLSVEFYRKLVDAMLMSLDCAFVEYDIYAAKSFFNFVLQLVNGKSMLKNLIEVVIPLVKNLAEHEASYQALKFLLGFLGVVLRDCGATKNILVKQPGKLLTISSSLSEGCKQLGSKKNTDTLVFAATQEAGSVSIDCDATSVDEDEEDGTSDGELASIDKDEEDNNSEKALASKVCTFTSSGSNFMEQHWYFCYTCDLTVSKGCCSVCAKVCHRGHRVVYSRFSRFFCDCGAGGVRGSSCQCLKPRKFTVNSSCSSIPVQSANATFFPFTNDVEQAPDSDSDLDDDVCVDIDGSLTFSLPEMVQSAVVNLLQELCMEDWILQFCDKLLPLVFDRRDAIISKDRKIVVDGDKVLSHKVDIFQLKKAYKSGSFDLKIRTEYSNSRELKCHITSGSLTKSLLTVSSKGKLVVAEGDKVSIFDVGQLIGQSTAAPVMADKSNIKHLSKNIVRFEIVHVLFNNVVENYLVVAGFEECQVLTVNPRGEVTDRLAIELALQGAYIRRVDWVPGSQVQLLVVTDMFVKIYDLSQDNISPTHYFTLEDDSIVDATLIVAPMGRLFLLVLSEIGNLFRLELSVKGDVGAKLLKEIVEVPKRETQANGHSLYSSPSNRLLFLSYQDGTTLIGRLDTSALFFTEISALYENDNDGKIRPAALHHWNDLLIDSGLFVSFSSLKQNVAMAISLGSQELFAQNIRHTGGSSALQLVGITAYKPLSKDKAHCIVLQEDGSLQIYLHTPSGVDASLSTSSDLGKRIGLSILSNKAYAGTKPEFPLDFFEKATCITSDIKLSGEAIKNSDSEGAKQKLTSDEGFLESPSPAGFKITVLNSNPDIVMVGFRLHVGNTSASHIPSSVTVFHRVIKLDEGIRSWYDVPFTIAESLLADEEFTITICSTFSGSTSPRIDCLEVYGRAKDEFGWKEKMDTFLDIEADMLGSNSGTAGTKKRCYPIKTSPIEEQLLADTLNLLSKIYFLHGPPHSCLDVEEANMELTKLKCKKMLEMIFEGDREAFLQSAACHVLQALFPQKEIYYHVKDTMRLFGVLRSSPTLVSKLGISSSAAAWVIKYFIAKTRIVTKIALLRRSNLAAFLETNGFGVVDGLMQVFWGILDYEQPDTQTINSVVIPCVELIYSYAECLSLHGLDASGSAIKPAVKLFKELLFAPYETVQNSSSLAISSRLLQVPFPKQTMLGTEEVPENPATVHLHHDVASNPGRNVQVVTEDDSTISSVQYCCDGCSTVPILRRRWHCNVCPDFDLCEACYEVMDADRLPLPHSSDHHMSAIPIDNDNLGGDNSEFQFSLDDLNDTSLTQFSEANRHHNALAPAHVLESSEIGEFPASAIDHSVVSISAPKRAVNSMFLHQLIYELRGWMKTTSGTQAIPLMQFFYRISSAVGGPFMDSSKPENLDLEKFVKWFLDEIDLNKPFLAKMRTSFGETAILVFMFLTLMLRNWHQPGSDSSQPKSDMATDIHDKVYMNTSPPFSSATSSKKDYDKDEFASQLARACSYLRQQALVNYLIDILQQLIPHFKSSDTNAEGNLSLPSNSGCGSLLVVRRELPAGNFSPFFSDSYAKAHRSDLFVDFHKLLLENTFRLLYSLIRPEKHEKTVEKDKGHKASGGKDLKLDGYQDVFCTYISNQHTVFVRRYARRLFLHLCGSKTQYYSIRDSWQISNEVKKLYKLVHKSGGVQSAVPYERSVKLVKCLSAIAEIAGARPRNWQKYCSKHGDFLCFIMDGIFHFGEETVLQTLKLLNFALFSGKDAIYPIPKLEGRDAYTGSSKAVGQSSESKKKKKGEDGNETYADKCLDMEHAVDIFFPKGGENLKLFIDTFLLEWNSTSVRVEAKCVLYGAWNHSKRPFRVTLVSTLLEKIEVLPMYGQNIVEYTELLSLLLGKVLENAKDDTEMITQCLTPDVINSICKTLHLQNELLANHPNSRIYNTLSSLVEFDGYYLESEPCVACSCPEVPYSRMKLETLKFETKFTDNRIIVKCTGSYTIQSMIMNVHDARKSKAVKVLNLYYNNRPVSDLSELKNNWSLWKRAKSCHLAFNQTELKIDFPIPITACNFMIELDSFYENLQASSQEALQCPRCSRSVTDKHGICSNCHENAYQCRQCRNINYENLDSFLCNECGYSKYGRFEFNFMARPSFLFDSMENDDDMKKGLAAIESESENAHRRYQQLMGFKKPLLKLVSSIGEQEIDSQHKDTVQQMMVSMPGPSCKINRKIALLGVLYGEKCKAAFDSLNKSVQTLQGLRRVLMNYLQQKKSGKLSKSIHIPISKSSNNCYGCAITFVSQCMELLRILSKQSNCKKQFVAAGILSELFENNIHQGPKTSRAQARLVLCAFSEGDSNALRELNSLIQKKVMYCLEHHRSMDITVATREELFLLSEACAVVDDFWEARLRVAFHLLFASIRIGSKNPAISEQIILPCLKIISQVCNLPKTETLDKEQVMGRPVSALQSKNEDSFGSSPPFSHDFGNRNIPESTYKNWDGFEKGQEISLVSYSEWVKGASYLDFIRRRYKIAQNVKNRSQKSYQGSYRSDYIALKYGLKWKRTCSKSTIKSGLTTFDLGSWVSELVLSPCSQSIRAEVCAIISLLYTQNVFRQFQLLNLLMLQLPDTLAVGESSAEYFELFTKMLDSHTALLFLTAKGCLATVCRLITQEVGSINSQETSLNIDISQGFVLNKLVELLTKFLEVSIIRQRFMREELLSQVLESLLVIRGLIVQKTKLISDCTRLLKDLMDGLLVESSANRRQFIRACVSGLQIHGKEKEGRTCQFILEQLCNLICPSKPEPVYLLILNKAHTQEEFIRGSMTKNPYSSTEIGPLMRDVKNKICHQLDLLGLVEDDYGMELLVAGNIISLDLAISQVYEQVWKKCQNQTPSTFNNTSLPTSGGFASSRDCSPMTITYRLQGLDGEATEPMIKEIEEEREESQDPEVEFAIAGAVREFGGLEIILSMIQNLRDDELKSNQEELNSVLNLLMYCCKIRENRRALLRMGALGLLLETARRAFYVDAMEPAEGILLIVESLTVEANESDMGTSQSVLAVGNEEAGAGDQAKKIVLMFLERLCHSSGPKKSSKQQRNDEMVARILPCLTYGELAAMDALIQHFDPYLHDWVSYDQQQKNHQANTLDENLVQQACQQKSEVENFVRVSESLNTSSCGEGLKEIILHKGITAIAVGHLRESFAFIGQTGFKTSVEWKNALSLPSVPVILSMLRGLARGHFATQKHIDEGGILPLLHALEGVSGENGIGAMAENLLDTLSDKENNGDGFLGPKVHELRHATRNEMRQRALKKREELLQVLGMRQEFSSDGGERIILAKSSIEGLEDVEEEVDGLACMVCREGYTLRPNDMLGVYSFSKRVNLGAGSSGSTRGECVYTTVSHFNVIHFQCHQEAKRADAALKNPKKEWEGAALRNNETLCNCIFPLKGPSVPISQYIRCVDMYWDNLNVLGRADGSRLRLLTYDIVLMLARFATGASFSTDSKGGGKESNSFLLPFMIQMACHLLDQGHSSQQRQSMAKSISAYLSPLTPGKDSSSRSSSLSAGRTSSVFSDDTVQFMMVNSLLSESYDEWSQHLSVFLQRGIYHAYMQHTHGRSTLRVSSDVSTNSNRSTSSSGTQPDDSSKLFSTIQPMLVYTGLIEQMQRFFKLSSSNTPLSAKESEVGSSTVSLEKWEVLMRERLVNVKEMLRLSKDMLAWLDDMTTAVDLQEAFDIMGALGVVFSGGYSTCDEFVRSAINSGKN